MLDKPESNMLFSGQRVNFNSLGTGTSHFQKTDMATSSYFIDMDIVEEISKKRKYMSLDNTDIPGYSPVSCRSNQYYDNDNFTMRQEAEFDHINKVLLSNLRPAYIQQKEPSLFHETYKEEIANLRDVERNGLVKQLEQSGYQSEYNCDLVSTFLHDEDEQQIDTIIPHFPVVLETSKSEKACLGMESLLNNAFVSDGKQDTLTSGHKNQSVESNLIVNASSNNERLTVIGDEIFANMDEQNKPINSRLSPVISEKIWDGSLKLNTSTTVSAVAFFKSGEKVQDLNWPDHVEIKGKVRLQAFEKFIQELPRSRTRALMVISLCWKLGSCERDLAAMMEVAKNYRESEKVGFAQIPPGIDLYVCPRSDTIITILAKYGFFKGMAAVEEDQDSLIGCVVWRRSQSSTNLASKTVAEGKKALMPEQPLKCSGQSVQAMNSPAMEKKVMPSEAEMKESSSDPPGSETAPSCSNSLLASFLHSSTTVQTMASSIPYSCPLVPSQQKTCEGSSLNLLQENMKPAGITPVTENSGEEKAVLVSESWTPVVVQSLGMFGSLPAPAPRPLIPVNSSNFQFQTAVVQNTQSSLVCDGHGGSDSGGAVKNPAPSFQAAQRALPGPPPLPAELRRPDLPGPPPLPTELRRSDLPGPPPLPTELRRPAFPGPSSLPVELRQPALPGPPPLPVELRQPALPGPPPLPIEILQSFIQSKKNVPKGIINGKMLQTEIHTKHHMETRRSSSFPRIQINSGGSVDDIDNNDDDDLPEFDFNSACEEQPDAPMSKLTHFPEAAPPLNKAFSFEAAKAESFEAFQHNRRAKTSPLAGKLSTSNEGFSFLHKPPSAESFQFKKQGNNDSGSKRRNMWDDDDMPEWCPPDLDAPEFPPPRPPSGPENALPPSARTPLRPSLSIRLPHIRDLQQASRHGLLGPRPSSDARAGGFSPPARPPLASRRTDSVRPPAGKVKFNRRPPHYAADHRRRRR
ncbi:hypothetical protein KSP39_PZI021118 [Platanthera zijinensis]|uniref:Spen paralogue and orthologue SPOC C-terminal domain-containing protein n=1 Tax=Platanthera zijinensis TaxID=2320716 RepID=A0AAP0AWL1_9ASPA